MSEMLPGMEMYQVDKPGEADLTSKVFTAAVVKKQFPGVYDSIIRALKLGLPNSAIAEVLRVSPQTVAAVKTTGAPLFLNERKRALRGSVSTRILESIERETSSEADLDAMPIDKRLSLLERLEGLKLGSDDSGGEKKPAEEIIDIESVSAFEDVLNEEMNSAQQVGSTTTSQTPQQEELSDRPCDSATLHRGGDLGYELNSQDACQPTSDSDGDSSDHCSTWNGSGHLRSVERSASSERDPIDIGSREVRGKSWGKPAAQDQVGASSGAAETMDRADAPGVAQDPRGAGDPPSSSAGV